MASLKIITCSPNFGFNYPRKILINQGTKLLYFYYSYSLYYPDLDTRCHQETVIHATVSVNKKETKT